jgi:hypothetical protein
MNEDFYIIKQDGLTIHLLKSKAISPGKALDMLLEDPELILCGLMKDNPEDVWQYKSCQNKTVVFKTNSDTWCSCLMELFVLDVFYTQDLFNNYKNFARLSGCVYNLESSFLAGSPNNFFVKNSGK